MTFEWALQELRDGRPVKRKLWEAPYSKLQQNIWLEYPCGCGPILRFLFSGQLSGEDLVAEDWIPHIKGEIK